MIAGILDAMRSDLFPAHRIVWACLENHANGHRYWDISVRDIAAECNLSEDTVTRAVSVLTKLKIVRVELHRWSPSTYHMLRSYVGDDACPHEADTNTASVRTKRTAEPARSGQPNPHEADSACPHEADVDNPPSKNPPRKSLSRPKRDRAAEPDGFAQFYDRYPRHVARADAAKAYAAALNRDAAANILAGLERNRPTLMRASEPRFIPHASTWLNGDRWQDGLFATPPPSTIDEPPRPQRAPVNMLLRPKPNGHDYDAWVDDAEVVA